MIWREPELGIANPEDYLDGATSEVRAAHALRDDLLAVLFPHGTALPTEMLQTQVKLKLQALVSGIEIAIGGESSSVDSHESSWELLARSGLLREKALIDFALARVAEDRLQKRLMASSGVSLLAQLPTTLLSHENAKIAEMANALLRAEQRALADDRMYTRVDPAQLHLLVWRIVAALQEIAGTENLEHAARAQGLLDAHDGEADPATIARKLAFFLGPDRRNDLLDPRKAGLQLFVAGIAQEFGLPTNMLFRLMGEASVAPLLLMLRGAGVPIEQLPATLTALRGSDGVDESPNLAEIYGAIDPVDARAQIDSWLDEMLGAA
jgi:hypothetical protein